MGSCGNQASDQYHSPRRLSSCRGHNFPQFRANPPKPPSTGYSDQRATPMAFLSCAHLSQLYTSIYIMSRVPFRSVQGQLGKLWKSALISRHTSPFSNAACRRRSTADFRPVGPMPEPSVSHRHRKTPWRWAFWAASPLASTVSASAASMACHQTACHHDHHHHHRYKQQETNAINAGSSWQRQYTFHHCQPFGAQLSAHTGAYFYLRN